MGGSKKHMILANDQDRLIWVDWMKFLGMYFIILGHLYPPGYLYIYTFNVPLFFVISGFLSKREIDKSVFWKKNWYNLVVPMLIISILNFSYQCVRSIYSGNFSLFDILKFAINFITGMHAGVGECWFVYTLILMKVIYQYSSNKKLLLWLIVFVSCAYISNTIDIKDIFYINIKDVSNSIINLCTAFPFYVLGILTSRYKNFFVDFNNKLYIVLLFFLSIFLIYLCTRLNGSVMMYKNDYGGDFILFIIGGIAGTSAIYSISKLIPLYPKYVSIVSSGTIILLGFNWNLILIIRRIIRTPSLFDYVLALIIVFAFVPLILFFKKKFPLILGKYRIVK